jgi:hypothetical protein
MIFGGRLRIPGSAPIGALTSDGKQHFLVSSGGRKCEIFGGHRAGCEVEEFGIHQPAWVWLLRTGERQGGKESAIPPVL